MNLGYLLDSNALLWFVSGSREMGKSAKHQISRAVKLVYSPVSMLELSMKQQVGKLDLDEHFLTSVKNQEIDELPFRVNHALEVARFGSLVRHDPFDRMLLAQASFERMSLITADQHLLSLGLPWVVDARQ